MTTDALLLAWVIAAMAIASPGPDFVAVASTAARQGRRAAFAVISGVASGMIIWAALTAVGLGRLLHEYPSLLTGLAILGGGYLLYLAWRSGMSARAGFREIWATAQPSRTDFGLWFCGLIVVLTNPKAAMLWSTIAILLFGQGLTSVQIAWMGPIAAATAICIYGLSAFAFSSGRARRVYETSASRLEAGFAAAFGVLGGLLIWDGIRRLGL